jgi:glyoxylase-like metal-dependent hydrolase (beta-lactamase superfamily II)
VRAVSLHRDVVVVTSALLQTTCTVVHGDGGEGEGDGKGETFVIDSPVLPEELELLHSLVAQAGYPPPSGLLATHGDWDHLLGRLAFPGVPLGCAESTADRLAAEPGGAQRRLRDFDDELYLERGAALRLGAVQPLPVPGRCDVGARELELHRAEGHTADGMAVMIGWAGVLVVGDYISPAEIPMLAPGGLERYRATLERLRPLIDAAAHVVPGHGAPMSSERALSVLEDDLAYLHSLAREGGEAKLPRGRSSPAQRKIHAENVAAAQADATITPAREP